MIEYFSFWSMTKVTVQSLESIFTKGMTCGSQMTLFKVLLTMELIYSHLILCMKRFYVGLVIHIVMYQLYIRYWKRHITGFNRLISFNEIQLLLQDKYMENLALVKCFTYTHTEYDI